MLDPATASNFALYWLTVITTLCTVGLVLKSRFWANVVRIVIFSLIFSLCATSWYLVARRNQWVNELLAAWSSFVIFTLISAVLTALFVLLIKHNWAYWSWMRDR